MPRPMVAAHRSGEMDVREVEKAKAIADTTTHCHFTLGTYEMQIPPITWPRSMPPPTTELCQPISIESVV